MLDQDTAHALLTVTAEAGATVALVGDRAQLPAVGRGGVLDMAAQIRGRTYDMSELHRFTDTEYAALTLAMRDRADPGEVFDRLAAMKLVTLHTDDEQAREHITEHAQRRRGDHGRDQRRGRRIERAHPHRDGSSPVRSTTR